MQKSCPESKKGLTSDSVAPCNKWYDMKVCSWDLKRSVIFVCKNPLTAHLQRFTGISVCACRCFTWLHLSHHPMSWTSGGFKVFLWGFKLNSSGSLEIFHRHQVKKNKPECSFTIIMNLCDSLFHRIHRHRRCRTFSASSWETELVLPVLFVLILLNVMCLLMHQMNAIW